MPHVDERLRKAHHVIDRREQTRVPGHTAHRRSVRVVHFAPKNAIAPRTIFRRCNAATLGIDETDALFVQTNEARVLETKRSENPALAKLIERFLRHRFDERTERDEIEIGIHRRFTGLMHEPC